MSGAKIAKEVRRYEREFNHPRCVERSSGGRLGAKTIAQAQLLVGIEDRIEALENHLAKIAEQLNAPDDVQERFIVPIVSLAPKSFVVLRDIPALVTTSLIADSEESQDSEEIEYVAQFVEAGVGSSGDSLEEAITNLKDRLIAKFDVLDNTPPGKLGRGPARQLAVLRTVIARADECREEAERKSQRN